MADPERKLRVEHVHETQHLSYGHFATANYDAQATHTWRFLRDDGERSVQTELREEVASTSTSQFRLLHQRMIRSIDLPHNDGKPLLNWKRGKVFQEVSGHHPEVALASLLLSGDDDVSRVVDVFPQGLALIGQRLSCSRAYGLDTRGHAQESRGTPITTSATGAAQEELWVSPIETDSVPLDDGSGSEAQIDIPVTSNTGLTHRFSSVEPILQISSSKSGGVLGVRKASMTTLLRPIWLGKSRRDTMTTGIQQSSSLSEMRTDAILAIPASRTGGYPHAHLSFNPKDDRQLAIIDTHGIWSIWALSGKSSFGASVPFRAQLMSSGRLLASGSLTAKLDAPTDGWHRICWLHHEDESDGALLICSRHFAAVYDGSGGMLGTVDMRIGVRSAKYSVLDVQPCVTHPDLCFVLTSVQIMVMRLADDVFDTERRGEPLHLTCSWNHFRAAQDLTLRMSVLEPNKGQGMKLTSEESKATTKIYFLVHSQRNDVAKLYTLTLVQLATGLTTSLNDPSEFCLPEVILAHPCHVSDIAFSVAASNDRRPTDDDVRRGPMVTLLARMEDGAICESVYEYADVSTAEKPDQEVGYCLPYNAPRQARQVTSSKYVDDDDDMAGFVVEDSAQPFVVDIPLLDQGNDLRQSFKSASLRGHDWAGMLAGETEANRAELSDALVSLRLSVLEDINNAGRTLADTLPRAGIDDVEEASESIAKWINDSSELDPDADTAGLHTVSVIGNTAGSLLERYDDLIDRYVGSLPTDVPDRVRVNAERLSRRTALEGFLASYALQQRGVQERQLLDERSDPKERRPAAADPADETVVESKKDDSPLSRLSRYTTINKTQAANLNKKVVTEVIGHLPKDITADPSDYSYEDTEMELAMARNQVDADLDPKAKRHEERLARFEKKRLERDRRNVEETALRQAMVPNQVMSSQLPQVAGMSQVAEGQMNATQPERGVFGGRQKISKPGKKRVAGF